ncbi:hypothetical protein [Actinomadura sp. HBU206391]|uniref:hypothetical protein n=1 Tax=Actinomadura sp. HBU206391 TaxID=2731692 RepID=UPI00164F6361|nr:hypothetical protein [Actinomadura sp. HBU206391]MBC6462080.1 hypothetical protein [Actinomadura sp. HBU206391]
MNDEWETIDTHIIERQALKAVQAIRAAFECGLSDAVHLLQARYDHLRQARPDDFTDSHAE